MFSMEIGKKAQILLQEPYFEFFLWNMLRIMQKSRFANFVATAGGHFAPCLENAMDNQTTGTQQQKITPKSWKFTIQKTPFTFRHHFLFFRHVFPRAPWLHQQHPEKLKRPPDRALAFYYKIPKDFGVAKLYHWKQKGFIHSCRKFQRDLSLTIKTAHFISSYESVIICVYLTASNLAISTYQLGFILLANWRGRFGLQTDIFGWALECTKIIPSWQKKP